MRRGGSLEIEGLTVRAGASELLHSVSFAIRSGEILALVGESGSGKSVLLHSLVGALKAPVKVVAGRVRFQEREDSLVGGDGSTFHERVRGRGLGLLLQDAGRSLHPTRRVGDQLGEMLVLAGREASKAAALKALEEVELQDGERILRSYPHQLSGGQIQRVAFALVLCGDPEVLMLDEPTTALDPLRREGVLRLLTHLAESRSMSLLLVTHDLPMAARVADHVLVLHRGRTVEWGTSGDVLSAPLHPFTQALLRSSEPKAMHQEDVPQPPADRSCDLAKDRCQFAADCPLVGPICTEESPRWRQMLHGRWVSCHAVESSWEQDAASSKDSHGP